MEGKVLVAYGSKYGATEGIARKIGEVLQQEGFQTDILSAKNAKYVSGYKAVIIGSAAYMFQWRKEVTDLLKKNETELAAKPVWLFTSGPLGEESAEKQMEGKIVPSALQPVVDVIKPRSIMVFHGAVDMDKLNFFEKFIFQRVKSPVGDFRKWDVITAWAKNIAGELKKMG